MKPTHWALSASIGLLALMDAGLHGWAGCSPRAVPTSAVPSM